MSTSDANTDLTRMSEAQVLALTGRELDAYVSEHVFRIPIWRWDWPCGYDPECGHYGAASRMDQATAHIYDKEEGDPFPGPWYRDRGPVVNANAHPTRPRPEPIPFYSDSEWWHVVEVLRSGAYHDGAVACRIRMDVSDTVSPDDCSCEIAAPDLAPVTATGPEMGVAVCRAALLAVRRHQLRP